MPNFDDLKLAVEALSGGRSTVLFDENMGTGGESFPSIMVRIPKFLSSDVLEGAPETAHPMFMVEGAEKPEVYISKYQNMVMHGRAYSLPFKVPAMGMTFDEALTYSEAKGYGWHLMTNAEYAGIMLWCVKNGFLPRGNYQSDLGNLYPHEKGVIAYIEDGMEGGVIATGSGPSSWTHDGTMGGICDLSGNLWEWASGLRLYNGEFQVIPDNNAALPGRCGDKSTYWRAILQDGSLAAGGTEATMKLDSSLATSTEEVERLLSGVMQLNTERANRHAAQIRRDNTQRRKFRWFSSVGKPDGTRAETWTHLAGPPQETVLITEGPLKADVIHQLTGQTVLAVPGVNSLKFLDGALRLLMEQGTKQIMTAFDMDYLSNPNVQIGYQNLTNKLNELEIPFGTYLWDPQYKGLDDYIWQFCYRQEH